jgi:hypothetical protein
MNRKIQTIIFSFGAMSVAGILAANQFYPGVISELKQLLPPKLPKSVPMSEVRWLEQGWSDVDRFWYHHASQGTSTLPIPYAWFMALEQPTITFFKEPRLLHSTDYLEQFGFIPSPAGDLSVPPETLLSAGFPGASHHRTIQSSVEFIGNPSGLPVGFAVTRGRSDPKTGEMLPDQIGFTCAACHTGHMTYNGVALRIDGGPAITDLSKFRKAIGLALFYTDRLDKRFERFAKRVLNEEYTPESASELRTELRELLDSLAAGQHLYAEAAKGDIQEGFGRLDALNRIGNTVFVDDLVGAPNFDPSVNAASLSAPVNYPHIWNVSWFDWVQYDASISQPMVRNAGEALGVNSRVNLANPDLPLYTSMIKVTALYDIESLLAGPDPFSEKQLGGLRSPEWPSEILGNPDPKLVAEGAELYRQHCQSCHLPPINSADFWEPKLWTEPNKQGQRFLKLPEIPVAEIGTDPAQANVLSNRMVTVPAHLKVDTGTLCGGEPSGLEETYLPFATALGYVVQRTVEAAYQAEGVAKEKWDRMNGYRENCLQAKSVYKARPLNGIWATAPFLHNGSVPDLYSLLLPATERPKEFCLGNREFDPKKVGYISTCSPGTNSINTSVIGNWNTGHSFEDAPLGKGVIGPALGEKERKALIEYLKTL